MNTRHLVDPEVLPVVDLLPAATLSHDSLESFRTGLAAAAPPAPEPPVAPEILTISGRDGAPDLAIYLFNPPAKRAKRPAILHVHGGGMILGTAEQSLSSLPGLALAFDAVGVSVDYRLAPETPFPGPQEDCYAALDWMVANADALGIDANRIIVMGESAGGGLAAALAQMVRDRGEYRLAGQVLIYPMLDHRTGGDDCPWRNPTTGEFVWTRGHNQFGWEALRGDYAVDDARAGWFSPARAADLAGLPPTYMLTGALDLFLDEDLDYSRRLIAGGVPVELHVYPGAIHAFNMMTDAAVSQQSARDLMAALARFLG